MVSSPIALLLNSLHHITPFLIILNEEAIRAYLLYNLRNSRRSRHDTQAHERFTANGCETKTRLSPSSPSDIMPDSRTITNRQWKAKERGSCASEGWQVYVRHLERCDATRSHCPVFSGIRGMQFELLCTILPHRRRHVSNDCIVSITHKSHDRIGRLHHRGNMCRTGKKRGIKASRAGEKETEKGKRGMKGERKNCLGPGEVAGHSVYISLATKSTTFGALQHMSSLFSCTDTTVPVYQ